jgi:nucleoside-diphosphate-sugar epimerase
MKVLVTGTEGYIGALLAPILIQKGHDVIGLDTGYYRDGLLLYKNGLDKFPACINKDIRNITVEDLEGYDAVIHLAELSNDPLGQLNANITFKINHIASVRLAKMCKSVGITRFIYTSSCSVYGIGSDGFKTEESDTNPQTAYAKCKVLVESDVSQLADDSFSPTFLRNATAYGPSPRMRFDVVLNNLSGLAWTTGEIKMTSDGKPWRPLVHVLDICEAISCSLEAPREIVHNQIFNVGDTNENYQVKILHRSYLPYFLGKLTFGPNSGDNRSYRVSFEKINAKLPGFRCCKNVAVGAKELRELFERVDMTSENFDFRAFTRLKQLEYLIRTRQIDDYLFWS